MRRLIFGTILFLVICPALFGQAGTDRTCPTVIVAGPEGVTNPGGKMIFSAAIANYTPPAKFEYSWTVSAGTIESGQGTPVINVATTREMANSNVTATVTVKMVGFSSICDASASESGGVTPMPIGDPADDFGKLARDDVKARVDAFFIRLNNAPDDEGVIVVFFKEEDTRASKILYLKYMYDAIVFRKYDPARVTFMISEEPDYAPRAILWMVPPGADYPEGGQNPILIRGEEFNAKVKTLFPKE